MKHFMVLLLLMSLCTQTVLSLYCFRCDRAKSHADCSSSIKCSDLERYCVSQTQQGPGESLMISKWCSPECPQFITEIKGANVSTECCQTDYCNSGGPSSVQSSCALVMVATLASFCYILQKVL
ncbi:lymphocyte antigen 6E-like [Candoia aspera]|uniref:lymphocyte antigen 6E-like n=1 Tax=Candoia aspera TaxID=51853 RepID=UPI002FD7D778